MSRNLPILACHGIFMQDLRVPGKMNDLAGSFIRKGFSSSVKGTKDT